MIKKTPIYILVYITKQIKTCKIKFKKIIFLIKNKILSIKVSYFLINFVLKNSKMNLAKDVELCQVFYLSITILMNCNEIGSVEKQF